VVGGTFVTELATALVMGLPILAIGNLGPASGWRRIGALVGAIAILAVAGAWMRQLYLVIVDPDLPWASLWSPDLLPLLWTRYVQQAGLLTLVVEFRRREARNIQAMHQAEIDRLALDREMAEARLQVLQAQIEPHFLFNTLANVRRLYQVDLAAGRNMIDNLMRYLEVALPRMRQSNSTIGRELGLVEAYLGVQAVRMGDRLAYEIDVPDSLQSHPLPPMMLLTLIENAIKHGLNPLPEGGRIVVHAHRDGERLHLAVVDDGRGFHASSEGGTGLANIRARLAALHADGARLLLMENLERGITSVLDLPVARPADEAVG
jgi:LytS/YehU family sensor histidine kinase